MARRGAVLPTFLFVWHGKTALGCVSSLLSHPERLAAQEKQKNEAKIY